MAAASAFEVPLPGVAAAGLQLSSLELTVLIALAAAALVMVREGGLRWRSPLTWPGAALLAAAIAAAVQAPAYQGNALRFCGRLLAAGLVAALAMNALQTRRAARSLVAVMLTVGAVVGAIALLEVSNVPPVLTGLKAFRPGFHVVGGQVRATSTLLYPTVTSMYLECVFAMGLWWIVEPPAAMRPLLVRLAPPVALLFVGAGIIATFTRTGLIVIAASLGGMAALRFARDPHFDQAQRALAGIAVAMIAFVAVSRTPEVWVSRVSADTAEDWYGARFEVPPRLSLRPSSVFEVPITVTNAGRLTWQSDRDPIFTLSYHWLTADTGEVVEFEGARTRFSQPVGPGQRVTMPVTVRAPSRSGEYQLAWDVVHEGRTWLSTMGVQGMRSQVRVDGPPDLEAPPPTHGQLPLATARLPRRTLWQAAARIARAHPFSGIGPDNFRLAYGDYLGLTTWDRRVHANNMYLEILTGTGVFGLTALAWLLAAAGRHLWTRWRSATGNGPSGWACLLAAWVGVAGHGLVDSFLTFTPTYVMFALLAGLAVSPALDAPAPCHANRL